MNAKKLIRGLLMCAIEYDDLGYEFQDWINGKWVTVSQYKLTFFKE